MRRKGLLVGFCTLLCLIGLSGFSHAEVTVVFDDSNPQTTTALTGYATTGAMMDGMSVTAYFVSGGSETASWADTGPSSGAAATSVWSLGEVGDTFGGTWTLSSTQAISSIFIDAGTGNSVLDITWPTSQTDPYGYGTDGSARGWTFELTSVYSGDITATYSGVVGLTGYSPVGDLYRYLNLGFSDGGITSMTFKADTDNLLYAGDINPVPEPTTLLLLGSGLGVLAAFRFRKR